MNITIVGAGNIGTQIAVHAAAKGHSVTIFTKNFVKFAKRLIIVNECNKVMLEGDIKDVTDDPDQAFSCADVIIITLPSFCQNDFANKYERYARNKLYVGFFPGTGGSECIFDKWLFKGVTLFGLQRVPSVARLIEYGSKVRATGYRDNLFLGALPNDDTELCCHFISSLFDIQCFPLPNYLNVTLTPSNSILHTSRMYCLFKEYSKSVPFYDSIPLFYEDWDIESAELLLNCDAEVQAIRLILEAYGFDLSYVKSLRDHYESYTPSEMVQKLTSIKGFKGLETPHIKLENGKYIPDLNSRYFKADFPYGLHILQQIGDIVNVDTPFIDRIWRWYEGVRLTSDSFSFADYGINTVNDFLSFYSP